MGKWSFSVRTFQISNARPSKILLPISNLPLVESFIDGYDHEFETIFIWDV